MTDHIDNYLDRNHGNGTKVEADVETRIIPLDQLRVTFKDGKKSSDYLSRKSLDKDIRLETPDGMKLRVSDRFWLSFSNVFGLSRSVFNYWSFDEVFNRISQGNSLDAKRNVRIAYERDKAGNHALGDGRLLSCTNPAKALLTVNEVNQLVERHRGKRVKYEKGVAQVSFDCPFPLDFKIGGDGFRTQFTMNMPVDGYGLPASYLTLLRLVCTNGMVGMTKAFRTSFQLGGGEAPTGANGMQAVLDRAIATFNNSEGFHSYRERLEVASRSWASLYEYLQLSKTLNALASSDNWSLEKRSRIAVTGLNDVAGYPNKLYGLMPGNEPSPVRARRFPVKATVYDLLNYATEVSTHHVKSSLAGNRLNAWVGDLVTKEFDLENSVTTYPDFAGLFIADSKAKVEAAEEHLNS